jgi:diguanylate cyclase (GGDEF)-like protein/PAS domain S-box-containing protein
MNMRADLREFGDGSDPARLRLQALLDAMPIAVSWASVADGTILYVNHTFTETLGYALDDLSHIEDWVSSAYPFAEDVAHISTQWEPYLKRGAAGTIPPMEVRVRCKNGKVKTFLHSGTILPDPGWVLVTFVDITDRKQNELALRAAERHARENEALYRLLLDNSPEMTVLSDADRAVQYVSPAVKEITGFTAEEFLSAPWQTLLHPLDASTVSETLKAIRPGDPARIFRYRIVRKGGGYRWVEGNSRAYADPQTGLLAGYVTSIRDISEQKRREDRLAKKVRQMSEVATLDELTGIANRRAFNRRFGEEANRADGALMELSLLMLDVDLFKQFNDLYGHLAGDDCLKRVAETLKNTIQRESDLVARYGGEEFVVLLPSTNSAGAGRVAENILSAIQNLRIEHAGSPHSVLTVSIGLVSCCYGTAPIDRSLLLEQVDAAMYAAKRAGRNRICFANNG